MKKPVELEIDEHTYACFDAFAQSRGITIATAMVLALSTTAQLFGDLSGSDIQRDVGSSSEQLHLPLGDH